MHVPPIRTDQLPDRPYGPESDACAIYLSARKYGQSTFGTLKRAIGALVQMGHRTGFVNGEGDGAGVQTDIPRRLWNRKLSQAGLRASLSGHPGFWVGHLFVTASADTAELHDEIYTRFDKAGLNPIYQQPGRTRRELLGGNARGNPPNFWQIAGYSEAADPDLAQRLLAVQVGLESDYPIHFLSLSAHVVVYKVRGSVETLSRYYPDLQDRNYDTSVVLSHARYSTNTVSNFERAQPFAILGHNGEINTITRLRLEAAQIGAVLPHNGSDSQDVDRTIQTLCVDFGLDLIEAMETIFPPVPYELEQFSPELRAVYTRVRQGFGPYAQGPAAILARYQNSIVASVDAVGLRPLWFVETEKEYVFSSERGALPLEVMVADPQPLGPGEKMAIHLQRGENPEILNHAQIRMHVMETAFKREAPQLARQYWTGWEHAGRTVTPGRPDMREIISAYVTAGEEAAALTGPEPHETMGMPWENPELQFEINPAVLAANGWHSEHLQDIADMVLERKDISSLGYDGPLAVLNRHRVNVADYFKETVAVVTNPAIDRGREMEVFSTSSLLGSSPAVGQPPDPQDRMVSLKVPILTGGIPDLCDAQTARAAAERFGTLSIEQLLEVFDGCIAWLQLGVLPGETVRSAIDRLGREAVEAVLAGAQCLVLDDTETIARGLGWLDPHLATSQIDEALRQAGRDRRRNLRRRAGLVVRSAAIRSLHDLALLSGFGADAMHPYAMLASAAVKADPEPALSSGREDPQPDPLPKAEGKKPTLAETQENLLNHIKIGLEKVISTMGCHELRGYGRVCSSIGLAPSVAAVLQTPNFFGSETAGLTWDRLDQEAAARGQELQQKNVGRSLDRVDHFFPKLWKKIGQFTNQQANYADYLSLFNDLKQEIPVALRHVIGLKAADSPAAPEEVDISVRDYSLPFVIGAMSFGSQGENSFRTYAHAASILNIICVNGEGGEHPKIMGAYKKNRGQQVASGRFGVNAQFLNSAAVLEIKIGQGAKPGEGGMLPAYKVTPAVAEARRTPPYVSLLSPSNNHDLYSIEDLAQLIEELKVVNPQARISVKCPVVPGIGVIAVGIVKAGADIINLSGYDGGTGAARKHALQFVGLPAEIGVIQAHRALVEAGLRHKVEIWCDGGMKTGEDVVKMVLLGANRVGFGTMAMVAIGCSVCHKCEEGTCHVGIATQIQTVEEAKEKGLKVFSALEYERAVERLVRMFTEMGEEVRGITARLGATRLQDLVGRGDLLEQVQLSERVDLSPMFAAIPISDRPNLEAGIGRLLVRPRNNLTCLVSDLIARTVLEEGESEITYQDSVMAIDRALGSHIVGALSRQPELRQRTERLHLRFGPSSIAGNGFSAWVSAPLDVLIEGGAQDGTAKGASGGRVAVLKGINHDGLRIDGSVGKSFAYGAQQGVLIVQGNADSRACIRLSGADVILGGEIIAPLSEEDLRGSTRANLKGFACEYMTAGRVVILGDPGPYAFSGMAGGVVYQMLTPVFGFDAQAVAQRIALGAQVEIQPIDVGDAHQIQELLEHYIEALEQSYQYDMVEHIRYISEEAVILDRFVKVVPQGSPAPKPVAVPSTTQVADAVPR